MPRLHHLFPAIPVIQAMLALLVHLVQTAHLVKMVKGDPQEEKDQRVKVVNLVKMDSLVNPEDLVQLDHQAKKAFVQHTALAMGAYFSLIRSAEFVIDNKNVH
jgi:hypothetical protein